MSNRKKNPPQIPPMEEHYPAILGMQLTPPDEEGNRALIVHIPLPNKIMVLPIAAEAAEELGRALLAPRVDVATPAEAAEAVSKSGLIIAK